MSTPPEILVRGPNWVGDLVMSTPGFRALRAGFPDARITLQLRPGLEALLSGSPWFDEIVTLRSHRKGIHALLREALVLRRSRRFDLGVCVPDSFSSALLMRAAGVRRIVGYRRGGRGFLLHQAVSPEPGWGRRRMVAREHFVLGLTAALGCQERRSELELFTTSEEEARADSLLGKQDAPLVALAPGASFGPSKLWSPESFARVGDALVDMGAQLILLGSSAERGLTKAVAGHMQAPARDLAGELDLGSLKAVLRRCELLVGNDAGARHVAVAFGVRCVVLFGPTSVEKTSLNLERVSVIEVDARCRPCYRRVCPIDHRCMSRIDPERVLKAARLALASERSGEPGLPLAAVSSP